MNLRGLNLKAGRLRLTFSSFKRAGSFYSVLHVQVQDPGQPSPESCDRLLKTDTG